MIFFFFVISLFFIQNSRPMMEESELAPTGIPARVYQSLKEDEATLRTYKDALEKVGQPRRQGDISASTEGSGFLDQLPESIRTSSLFSQWLIERFPVNYRRDFLLWQKVLVSVRRSPVAVPFVMGKIEEALESMLTVRRVFIEEYGELALVLSDDEKRHAFRAKNDQLAQQLMETGAAEDDFFDTFNRLQGEVLTVQQRKMAQAQSAQAVLQKHLQERGGMSLIEEIKEQKGLLPGGRLAKMVGHKMNFYRDAFLFFYQKQIEAFVDKKTGVESLWKHLSDHKDKVKAVENGETLYGCLGEQRHQYQEARTALKEWLKKIRSGTEEAPEKSSLKPLMSPKKTLDLDQSFGHLEEEATTHLTYILRKEAELNAKIGHWEEGDKNSIQPIFEQYVFDVLEGNGAVSSGTYDLVSVLEKLASAVASTAQEMDQRYAEVLQKWAEASPLS